MTELQNMLQLTSAETDSLQDWQPPVAPLTMPTQVLTAEPSVNRFTSWMRGLWLRASV